MKKLTIKEEQNIQFKVLKYFDFICKNEHLEYFLAYGTLLGAIRQNGFIEWDDDIDIWMKRDQYELFVKIFNKYENKDYFLQTIDTDVNTLAPAMARICVNGTKKWSNRYNKMNFHKGIYFDIFPLDFSWKNKKKEVKNINKYNLFNSILYMKTSLSFKELSFKGKLIYPLMQVLSQKYISNQMIKCLKMVDFDKEHLLCYPARIDKKSNYFDSKFFKEIIEVDFEGLKCPCPSAYNEILTNIYGEDWKKPKKTKNYMHDAYIL